MSEEPENIQFSTAVLEKLDQIISVLLDNRISPKIPLDVDLWNTQDVASYLGFSYKYTNEYIITEHSFPNELRFPLKNGKKSHPRWYAGEVMKWASNQKITIH